MIRSTASLGCAALALLLHTSTLGASPLRLDCADEQKLPGRALVCEYPMLGGLNSKLSDLHDRIVREGRAARLDVKRWLSARDACGDVDCLDQLLLAGIRAAQLALVDVETRRPMPILTNARGVPMQVQPATPKAAAAAHAEKREPATGWGAYAALLLVAVAIGYAVVARRLTTG